MKIRQFSKRSAALFLALLLAISSVDVHAGEITPPADEVFVSDETGAIDQTADADDQAVSGKTGAYGETADDEQAVSAEMSSSGEDIAGEETAADPGMDTEEIASEAVSAPEEVSGTVENGQSPAAAGAKASDPETGSLISEAVEQDGPVSTYTAVLPDWWGKDTRYPTGKMPSYCFECPVPESAAEFREAAGAYAASESFGTQKAGHGASEWDQYSSHYLYSRMNADEKALYDALYETALKTLEFPEDLTEYEEIDWLDSEGRILETEDLYFLPLVVCPAFASEEKLEALMTIFAYENPQFYFLSSYSCSISIQGGKAYVRLHCIDDFRTAKSRQAATEQIRTKLKDWMGQINAEKTDLEKELKIHELVLQHVEYQHIQDLDQSVYSAIVLGKSVCMGYAGLTAMLFNAAGFDCQVVTSQLHAWNFVRLRGTWYHIDTTWDDEDEYPYIPCYDFFNRDAEGICTSDIGGQEGVHTPEPFFRLPSFTKDSGGRPVLPRADGSLFSFEILVEDGKAKLMPPKGSTAYYQIGTAEEPVCRLGSSYFDSTAYSRPFALTPGDVIYAKAERTDYEDSPVMVLDPFTKEVRENIEVTGVSLNQTSITLKPGLTANLTASLTPADAEASYQWMVLSKTPSDLQITVNPSGTEPRKAVISAGSVPGTAVVSVTATGKEGGSAEAACAVTIQADEASLAGDTDKTDKTGFTEDEKENNLWFVIDQKDSYVYTGAAIKPSVRVYSGTTLLTEKTDYTISYSNNTKAYTDSSFMTKNPPTVKLSFKGNYSGTLKGNFVIAKAKLSAAGAAGVSAKTKFSWKKNDKGERYKAYTKQYLKPGVYYAGKKLALNRDYVLSYPDTDSAKPDAYGAPGTYRLDITAKEGSDFEGSLQVEETLFEEDEKIKYIPLSDGKVKTVLKYHGEALSGKNKIVYDPFTGTADIPTPVLTFSYQYKELDDKGKTVTRKDSFTINESCYTAQLLNGDRIGSASVILTGQNTGGTGKDGVNYRFYGSRSMSYTVHKPAAVNIGKTAGKLSVSVNGITEGKAVLPYLKGGVKPSVKVSYNRTGAADVLKEGIDYRVSYGRNNSVTPEAVITASQTGRMPYVRITGMGNYTGHVDIPFLIEAQDLGKMNLYLADVPWSKTKNAYRNTKLSIRDYNGQELKKNADYTVQIRNAVLPAPAAGTPIEITIRGRGNYQGSIETVYYVREKNISSAGITFFEDSAHQTIVKSWQYTGLAVEPKYVRIVAGRGADQPELKEGEDYEIAGYYNNTARGKAWILIRGKGNYGGMAAYAFSIGTRKVKVK